MNTRQKQLLSAMQKAGLDAVLLTSSVNIRYYCGFASTDGDGTAVLTHKGFYLITDFRYTIQAVEQTAGCAEVLEKNYSDQAGAIRDILAQDGCRTCGFEQEHLTVSRFEEYRAFPVTWRNFGAEIKAPRAVKSADELDCLAKAQAIADKSYSEFLTRVRPGMSELDCVAELNYVCGRNGSEGPSFDTIIGSGPNGAMCHAIPGGRKLQSGDLVVVDFGCVYGGYHSDMTRTFGIGSIDAELVKIYGITLESQLLALDAVRAGITGSALDAVARDHIASFGYGEQFGHGLGHGFGLEIHEPPRAGKSSADVLAAGMTVTVEPGIYLEGRGGVRIEDCVAVTETGCRNFVSTAKDLLIL